MNPFLDEFACHRWVVYLFLFTSFTFSLFSDLLASFTHIYLFAMYTYWIPGLFLSRCTVFQHCLSLIASLHHHPYHFYLLRRIFVEIIFLPLKIKPSALLSYQVRFERQAALWFATS